MPRCLTILWVIGSICLFVLGCQQTQTQTKEQKQAQFREQRLAQAKARQDRKKSAALRQATLGQTAQEQVAKLMDLGRYAEAAAMLERGLAQMSQAKGPEDPGLLKYLISLCHAYEKLGEYARAEQAGKRALAIIEKKKSGIDAEQEAQVYYNLGRLFDKLGDGAKAERHLNKALALRERIGGEESPGAGYILIQLGNCYRSRKDYRKAEDCLQRALTILQKKKGYRHRSVADVLKLLARINLDQKKYDQAESYFRQALSIMESAKGPQHPDLLFILTFFGALYVDKGDYAQAEPLLQRALTISDTVLGPLHPDSSNPLTWLSILQASRGEYGRALESLRRVQETNDKIIHQVMGFTSEGEKMSFLETRKQSLHILLHLVANHLPQDKTAVKEAMSAWLKRKGIVLEAQRQFQEALIDADNTEAQKTLAELDQARREMSRLVFGGGRSEIGAESEAAENQDTKDPKSNRTEIVRIEAEIQRLEARLSRQSQAFAQNLRMGQADAVKTAKSLPPDSVLVEFVSSRAFSFGPSPEKGRWGPGRYLAFILPAGQVDRLVVKDLGEAGAINKVIVGFKKALAKRDDQNLANVTTAARRLYDLVWAPLKAEIGSAGKVFISPDGVLNLIPFEVFLNPEGRYLIEDHAFYYLTSGRDVLGFDQARAGEGSGQVLLFGDPDFWLNREQREKILAKLDLTPEDEEDQVITRAPVELETGRGLTFNPLPGTRAEVRAISELVGTRQARPHLGAEAVEEVLRQSKPPRYLHLATHGFFLEDMKSSDPDEQGKTSRNKSLNPLVRSGLALAGANQAMAGKGHEGIFTAEKVLGLRLRDTELVVLSACETGLGEVAGGEGVFGLRRAFTQVGAKSLVMSMWSVPDLETAELMIEFYKNLLEGRLDRGEALRQAMLKEMRTVQERRGSAHPYYWGAFVFLGQP
ncbi:MAG: CHAT domain-containing tetratricopeptide repeat protein [Thermodesulfobacteriota bacterium]